MKQYITYLWFVGISAFTIGCSARSPSLTSQNPFQTDADPFQVAAAMEQQEAAGRPTQQSTPPGSPGYAAMNGPSQFEPQPGSKPGWSTTRHAPAETGTAASPRFQQTAASSPQHVQLNFRAASSLPESRTEVIPSAVETGAEAIPTIGGSKSREMTAENPFAAGGVQNADFTGNDKPTITQLGTETSSTSSPATLEMPEFADEEIPVNQPTPKSEATPAWWEQ